MAGVTQITNYLARARTRLLTQFQGLPRIDGLVQAYTQEVQALENAMWAVYIDRQLQQAIVVGDDDLLNKLGAIVGMPRLGQTNAIYLTMIQAKIKANRSNGLREELITIMSLLQPATVIVVNEIFPSAVNIQPQGALAISPLIVLTWFLAPAKDAGVMIALVWSQASAANTVTLGSIYNPSFTTGPPTTNTGVVSSQCMGSIYNGSFAAGPPDANTGGGVLAGVVQL